MKKKILNIIIFIVVLSFIPKVVSYVTNRQLINQNTAPKQVVNSPYTNLSNKTSPTSDNTNVLTEKKIYHTPFWKFEIEIPSNFISVLENENFMAFYQTDDVVFQIRNIDTYDIMKEYHPDLKRNQLNYTKWDPHSMKIALEEFSNSYFELLLVEHPELIIDSKEIITIDNNTGLQLFYHYTIPDSDNNEIFYSEAYEFMINGCNVSFNIQYTEKNAVNEIRNSIYSVRFLKL